MPGGLGREKWLEHHCLGFFVDAFPGVRHDYPHLAFFLRGADRNLLARPGGIAGVGQQIDDHLRQLLRIAEYVQPVRTVARERDFLAALREANQVDGVFGDGAQVDGLGACPRLAAVGEAAQRAEDAGNAAGLLEDSLYRFA